MRFKFLIFLSFISQILIAQDFCNPREIDKAVKIITRKLSKSTIDKIQKQSVSTAIELEELKRITQKKDKKVTDGIDFIRFSFEINEISIDSLEIFEEVLKKCIYYKINRVDTCLYYLIYPYISELEKIQITGLEYDLADTINGIYIPKDIQDCMLALDKQLSDSLKKEIVKKTNEDFCVTEHFGLGLWIRNNWQLWHLSRLYAYFREKGIKHPDSMSSLILEEYYNYLKQKSQ
jgi:hypothetical protein